MSVVSRNYYKLFNKAFSKVFSTPPYIILFVSDVCRMKCRHCWYSEAWQLENIKAPHLSFDEIEKMSRSVKYINFLSITGGEAFLRKEIVEITKVFAKNTGMKRYDIPTSGFDTDLTVKKTEEILIANPGIPFRVNISLEGPEEIHDYVRNKKGSFKRAVATLGELRKLKKKYSYFDTAVITTVSNHNQNDVINFANEMRQLLPDGEWMVNLARGETRDSRASQVDLANYIALNKILDGRLKSGNFTGDVAYKQGKMLTAKNAVRREIIIDTVMGKRKGGGCGAGTMACVIYNNGDVRPCEMLNDSIGNVRDYDYNLPKLFSSPEALRIRNFIEDSYCKCTHECFLSVSILKNPSDMTKLLAKRAALK